jgi:hypothetical protein
VKHCAKLKATSIKLIRICFKFMNLPCPPRRPLPLNIQYFVKVQLSLSKRRVGAAGRCKVTLSPRLDSVGLVRDSAVVFASKSRIAFHLQVGSSFLAGRLVVAHVFAP